MDITTTPVVNISNGGSVALQVVGAGTVFVGQDAADPTAEGLSLASGNGVVHLQAPGRLYAATLSGTVDLRVLSV